MTAKPDFRVNQAPHWCMACDVNSSLLIYYKNEFPIFRCVNCKMLTAKVDNFNPYLFYDDSYFFGTKSGFGFSNYEEDKKPMYNAFKKFLQLISIKNSSETKEIFDVGAATGIFVEIAQNAGWTASGCEPSEYAQIEARKKKLSIQKGTIKELNIQSESFDVVTFWDVLEHLEKPNEDFIEVSRILRPGGLVAISTPDCGSLLARSMGSKWHHIWPPEHINYFNKKSMQIFLKKHSLMIEHISSINKQFSLEYLFASLSKKYTSKFLSKLAQMTHNQPQLGKISIPINFHDTIFVLARKANP